MKTALRSLLIVWLAGLAGPALAATFTVTKIADTNDGTCDADCSLREAVVAANAAAGADTIILPSGTYVLTLPDTNEDLSANGDLDVNGELTITGAGAGTTIIDGNNASRILHVFGSQPLTISDVTVRNGNGAFGGGINHEGSGTLTLTNVVIEGNDATGFGGGINNNSSATITLVNSTVSNNTATGFGGGINNNVGGTVTLTGSTVSGNTASGFGGGINNNLNGVLTVTLSTVTGNTGTNGGGINNNNVGTLIVDRTTVSQNAAIGSIGGGGILNNNNGPATIIASTIAGNTTAGFGGGGIDNNFNGTVQITNSTVSGNTVSGSNGGGGVYNNSAGTVTLENVTVAGNGSTNGGRNLHNNGVAPTGISFRNTIIANPASGSNCAGPVQSLGDNIATDASCSLTGPGDLPGTNPLLGPLANNGGPTLTHGLQAGSPAVDAGNAAGAPAVDQRGVARPQGAGIDIGAFEGTIGAPVPTLSINGVTANEGNAGATTFTFTVTLSAASGSTVTVDFSTADGTAIGGSDYTAANGTLTFLAGVTSQAINVTVLGDTVVEPNETFLVNLSNPSGATIAAAQGLGTIVNEDTGAPPPPPTTPADIPTLSEWMLLLLASLLAMMAWARLRGR